MRALRRLSIAAAFAVTMGLAAGSAQAGVAMPATGTAAPAVALTENVHWVCGAFHCWWRPNYPKWYLPPYARGWGPPPGPTCYWRRGWNGAWVQVCP